MNFLTCRQFFMRRRSVEELIGLFFALLSHTILTEKTWTEQFKRYYYRLVKT
jgi:hypothetical protein